MSRAACLVCVTAALATAVFAADGWAAELNIRLVQGSEAEQAAEAQLRRLVAEYPVDAWIYTERVSIDERQRIPHSHPVLTLNARYVDDDLAQLATFLHEQFHWYAAGAERELLAAIDAFKRLYPEVPSGRRGARNEFSTYLHLVICDLEYQAMAALIGVERATKLLSQWRHYAWIYEQVLQNPEVRRINTAHGFVVAVP